MTYFYEFDFEGERHVDQQARRPQHHPDVATDPSELDESHFERDLKAFSDEQAQLLEDVIDGDNPPEGYIFLTNTARSAFSWGVMKYVAHKASGRSVWINRSGDIRNPSGIGIYGETSEERDLLGFPGLDNIDSFFADTCNVSMGALNIHQLSKGSASYQKHHNALIKSGVDADTAEVMVRRSIMSSILIRHEYMSRGSGAEFIFEPSLKDSKVYNRLASRGYKPLSTEELYGMAFRYVNPGPPRTQDPEESLEF